MKRLFTVKALMWFIFLTFIVTAIYTFIRIILAPAVAPSSDIQVRVKGDYVLMLVQCILGVFLMLIPGYLRRRVNLNIPTLMMIAYAVFLYCAIFLGEMGFYYRFSHWDSLLHIFSGVGLGALGFSLVSLLNKSEAVTFSLSPFFVALFAFCFAVSLGVIWEIYEFTVDYFLKTNMQKYALEQGEQLIGQAALMDTMKDLIVDAIGGFVMSVIGYMSLKHKKGWLDRLRIKRLEK
ncbi:MAG: hypothetical protein FWF88_02295 [Peptococcaceae bacterium]|jgi:hypothetical protein|nr:hypothetical protein [Peptococcaceae bacterium]